MVCIALCVIALACIGVVYALTYDGETQTTSNTTEDEYILLTLGDDTAADYTGSFVQNVIPWDTVVNASGKTWYPVLDTDTDDDSEYDAVKVGSAILHVDVTNTSMPYIVKMSKTAGTMDTTKFVVGVKIGSGDEEFVSFGATEFALTDELTGDKTITLSMYYKATSNTTGPTTAMNGVTFSIKAYATDE